MGLWDKVKSGVSNLGSTVAKAAESVESKASEAVQGAEQAVAKVETKVVDVAKSEFAEAKDFAKVTGSKLEAAASHVADAAKSVRLNPLAAAEHAYQVLADKVSGSSAPHAGEAGRSDFSHPATSEAQVRANTARNTQWSMDDIKRNPDAFLKNVVQVDGLDQTSSDYTACGTTSVLMGMIAGRPESVQELASKLVDANGNVTAAGQKLFGPDANAQVLKDAVKHIRDGHFSAADVTLMSEGLLDGMPNGAANGTKAQDLIQLRASITQLGVSVPRMELQQFGSPDGGVGHWRVGINGKQYNPWPDSHGQSSVITGPGGLTDGASDGQRWVNREKVYIDDNTVAWNVYSITTKNTPTGPGQSWSVNDDPPLFVVRYQRQADGSFNRTDVDARRMRQLAPGLSQADIDRVFQQRQPTRAP